MVGGFQKLDESAPHGTNHAAYTSCSGLVEYGAFEKIDLFIENAVNVEFNGFEKCGFTLPPGLETNVFDVKELPYTSGQYDAVYFPGTGWLYGVPYAQRPLHDTAPVIVEVDCSHLRDTWNSLFSSLMGNIAQPTDGLIFKSAATKRVFDRVWTYWCDEFGLRNPLPVSLVSPNPIDPAKNEFNPGLRKKIREALNIRDEKVVFLTFSRIEPFTKGDGAALLLRWAELIKQDDRAVLLMCGAVPRNARPYVETLRTLARSLNLGANFILMENPYDYAANARNAFMSAADVFLHLSTGVEESAPLTLLEAMAHGLSPIVAGWSGMVEQVQDGQTGFVVPVFHAPAPEANLLAFSGREFIAANCMGSQMAIVDPVVLVNRLSELSSNAPLRKKMGDAAKQFVLTERSISKISKQRAAFIRRLAEVAKLRDKPFVGKVPVHLDHIVSELAFGRSLPETTLLSANQKGARLDIQKWINPRFLPIATQLLAASKIKPVTLGQIVNQLVGLPHGEGDRCDSEIWESEPSKHAQLITLRLIAGGYLAVMNEDCSIARTSLPCNGEQGSANCWVEPELERA